MDLLKHFIHGKMRRCNVLDNHTVSAYLGDLNYREDGTNGQVMVEIPKFYFKKVFNASTSEYTFEVSDVPKLGYILHPAFFRDRNGEGIAREVDFRYFSAFLGYNNGGKLESKSGVLPTTTQTISTFRNQAQARGKGWGLVDYNLLYAIQVLYLTEYGDFNSQKTIGRGFVDGNTSPTVTGGTSARGNNSYGEISGKHQMSYRGIEDLYGNLLYWIDGIVSDVNFDILIGNKSFNDSGTGYLKYNTSNTSNTSGYITDIQPHLETGFCISVGGGTELTSLCDYGNLNASQVAYFGGDYSYGSNAGVFDFRLNYSASGSNGHIGGRLAL